MRHRRHTLRATALLHCAAVVLVAPLTTAASPSCDLSDELRDANALRTQAAVAGLIPQEPNGTEEYDQLLVRVHLSDAGTGVTVRRQARAEKSPGSEGTSRASRSTGPAGQETTAPHRPGKADAVAKAVEADQAGRADKDNEDSKAGTDDRLHGKPGGKSEHQHGRQSPRHITGEDRLEATHRTHSPAPTRPERSPSPVRQEHSRTPSSAQPDAPSRSGTPHDANSAGEVTESDAGAADHKEDVPGRADAVFGTSDLYEPELQERGYGAGSGGATGGPAAGRVSPVLPLGAGLTSIGLGLALLAVRLRRG